MGMRKWFQMAVTFLALCLACAGAAITVFAADPQWAKDHRWLGPWLWVAAAIFLILAALARWLRRRSRPSVTQPPENSPVTSAEQQTHGNSSPNILATHGSNVKVDFGAQNIELEKRPFVRPVEYCESIDAEYIRVINEGERAYDLYTEPVIVGDWVIHFERLPDLKGEGRVPLLRLMKTSQVNPTTTHIETLQTLDHAWSKVERDNPNFTKPWLRIHYQDHKNKPFLSQCRLTRLRDIRGNISFRFVDFSDLPA
jgi:membrane protein implicated in regulation of membrane protease activity